MLDKQLLAEKAAQIRIDLLEMIYNAGMGHTGSSLSNTDILTTLYYSVMNVNPNEPNWEDRDRFVLSKGHAVESYYCILADLGFIDKDELTTFCQYQSRLIGHPNNKVPGVEMNTGALGHGLSVAVGMAKAAKMDKRDYRVFVLMGDGEQAEGSIWEASMSAAHFGLDNLIGIIDRNRLQITGSTEEVMALEPLAEKWKSFGWQVVEVDGHDFQQLRETLSSIPVEKGRPTLVVANTVKGKGVSFSENNPTWHHHVPSEDELNRAIQELKPFAGADNNG